MVVKYGKPARRRPYGNVFVDAPCWIGDSTAIALRSHGGLERVELLVGATDDRGRVEAQPLLQQRPVDASEVEGVLHVLAVQPVARLDRRVLRVEAALDVVA